jgi:hypothetical protein
VVAHELAHGAFNLFHTFGSEKFVSGQGTTDNLLDYKGGMELWKYQWKFIHDPQNLWLKFLQDEEEGEMVDPNDKDNVDIIIESADFDFAPGIGQMKIDYSFDKKSMEIMQKYPDEKTELKIAIANNKGKFVHMETKAIKEKDTYIWSGITEKGDTINIADGPYNVAITLMIGEEKDWFDSWQTFKDKLYESLRKDSVQQIIISKDTSFTIDPIRVEWGKNKDLQRFCNNYEMYKYLYSIYMTYDGIKDTGGPLEYLKNNTTTFNFLGKDRKVHKEFALILMKVEEKLKQKGVYEALKEKYSKDKSGMGTLYMREINDPNGKGKISEHGFGMAIDLGIPQNPQILQSNILVQFFIKRATGFDLGVKKSVSEIKNAHNKFVKRFSNIDNTILAQKYSAIQKYHTNELSIRLDSLQMLDKKLNTLQNAYNEAVNDSISPSNINQEIISLINNLESFASILEMYKNTIIFNDNSINTIENTIERIKTVSGHARQLMSENNIAEANFGKIYSSDIDLVINEINDFSQEIYQINKNYQNLNQFGSDLVKKISLIGFGNVLLKDGFCDVELELIEAFLESDSRIQWGGIFTKKIDAMHFGFTTNAVQNIINNKK